MQHLRRWPIRMTPAPRVSGKWPCEEGVLICREDYPPDASKTVIGTGTSASTTGQKAGPRFGCAAHRGARTSWHNLIMPRSSRSRLRAKELLPALGAGSASSILLNARTTYDLITVRNVFAAALSKRLLTSR